VDLALKEYVVPKQLGGENTT
jgi:hypothetical protein